MASSKVLALAIVAALTVATADEVVFEVSDDTAIAVFSGKPVTEWKARGVWFCLDRAAVGALSLAMHSGNLRTQPTGLTLPFTGGEPLLVPVFDPAAHRLRVLLHGTSELCGMDIPGEGAVPVLLRQRDQLSLFAVSSTSEAVSPVWHGRVDYRLRIPHLERYALCTDLRWRLADDENTPLEAVDEIRLDCLDDIRDVTVEGIDPVGRPFLHRLKLSFAILSNRVETAFGDVASGKTSLVKGAGESWAAQCPPWAVVSPAPAREPGVPDGESVPALVAQLGHADFAAREKATAGLLAMGYAARSAVQAALGSDDPEIAERAQRLWESLRWRVFPGAGPDVPEIVRSLGRGNLAAGRWKELVETHGPRLLCLLAELSTDDNHRGACTQGIRTLLDTVPTGELAAAIAGLDTDLRDRVSTFLGTFPADALPAETAATRLRVLNLLWQFEQCLVAATADWLRHQSHATVEEAVLATRWGGLGKCIEIVPEEQAAADSAGTEAMHRAFRALIALELGKDDAAASLLAEPAEGELPVRTALEVARKLLAARHFDAVLGLLGNRTEPQLRYLHTVALREQGETTRADTDLQALIDNIDSEADCYSVADTMGDLGDVRAESLWRRILAIGPDKDTVYDCNAYLRLAPYAERRGEYGEAANLYEKALAKQQGVMILSRGDGTTVSGDDAIRHVRGMIDTLRAKVATGVPAPD